MLLLIIWKQKNVTIDLKCYNPCQIRFPDAPSTDNHNGLFFLCKPFVKKHDNILSAYPGLVDKSDSLYEGGEVSFLACNTMALIFAVFEMLLLFIGTNLFRERINFISKQMITKIQPCTS